VTAPELFIFGAEPAGKLGDADPVAPDWRFPEWTGQGTKLEWRLHQARARFSRHFTRASAADLTGFESLAAWEISMRAASNLKTKLEERVREKKDGTYSCSLYSSDSSSESEEGLSQDVGLQETSTCAGENSYSPDEQPCSAEAEELHRRFCYYGSGH